MDNNIIWFYSFWEGPFKENPLDGVKIVKIEEGSKYWDVVQRKYINDSWKPGEIFKGVPMIYFYHNRFDALAFKEYIKFLTEELNTFIGSDPDNEEIIKFTNLSIKSALDLSFKEIKTFLKFYYEMILDPSIADRFIADNIWFLDFNVERYEKYGHCKEEPPTTFESIVDLENPKSMINKWVKNKEQEARDWIGNKEKK